MARIKTLFSGDEPIDVACNLISISVALMFFTVAVNAVFWSVCGIIYFLYLVCTGNLR